MTKSDLASIVVEANSSNYTKGRKEYKICKLTVHHMAGILTAEQCGKIFQSPNRDASSNYGIGNDGKIACYVGEEDRAWASSSATNDYQAITVEVSNNEIGGDWKVSDAAWNALVNLAVDVCKRYNFRLNYDGTPNGSLTTHNMFIQTTCPGAYLKNKLPELADTVNAILDGSKPKPIVPTTPVNTNRKVGDVVTINGVYTASNSTNKLNPARTTGTITRIVEGALNPYLLDNGNLGWVNDNVIVSVTTTASKPNVTTTAIKKGDKVKVLKNVDYNGTKLISSIVNGIYDVIEVNGDRIVIGKGKNVTAAMNKSSLQKV